MSLLIFYDGDCGLCLKTRRVFERCDPLGVYRWETWQSGAGRPYGISDEALQDRVHVVAGGRVYAGFHAFQEMLLANPVFYAAAGALLTVPNRKFRAVTVTALLAFFWPPLRPAGESVYRWVAHRRHGACTLEPKILY